MALVIAIQHPGGDPSGHETLVVDSTAGGVAMTTATINPTGGRANAALVTVEDQPARYTVDGTPPTTTLGHLVDAGSWFVIRGANALMNFRAIRTTGSSSSFRITYYRDGG